MKSEEEEEEEEEEKRKGGPEEGVEDWFRRETNKPITSGGK